MENLFENGSNDTRDILIRIDDDLIAFYFYEQYCRRQEWIDNETERRFEVGEDELTEDEAYNAEFYWIPKDDWISDRTVTRQGREDNWHYHMMRKSWFTQEMKYYIDNNTKI